jgi:arabinofuranan 3-O-arabinosyltransferase
LIVAGAVLCRHPWRSVDGYAGHSAGAQLAALVSVAALVATAVVVGGGRDNLGPNSTIGTANSA